MHDLIDKAMSKKLKWPTMSKFDLTIDECDIGIKQHMSTKQVIHLTKTEVETIFNEQEIAYPEFLLRDNHTQGDSCSIYSVEGITDGYQLSEYFGNINRYIPESLYYSHIHNNHDDFVMNVYNGRNAEIPIDMIQSRINKFQLEDLPENYNFGNVRQVKYSKFDETRYVYKNSINRYLLKFPILSVNVPYEYYATQDIPENIYTWDIDKHEFCFAGKTNEEIDSIFDDICTNGIQSPMFMQIHQGKIVSASDDTYIILLMAKYLKLPVIPATLYMINNCESNLLLSTRPFDIIGQDIKDFNATAEEVQMANEMCIPYFLFYNEKYGTSNDRSINVNDMRFYKLQYWPDKDERVEPVENLNVMDYHLDPDQLHLRNSDMSEDSLNESELHEQLRKEAQDKIQRDMDEYFKKLESSSESNE